MRFTLERGCWYAAEFIGGEFGRDIRSFSPVRVNAVKPAGNRHFVLDFYHANYPEGVRDKSYRLQTIERAGHFLLARSADHSPARYLLIHALTAEWLGDHFGVRLGPGETVEGWLGRNA